MGASKLLRLGWREWVALPELGIDRVKAKIDTGARTSALHAYHLETYVDRGAEWVEFKLHPKQRDLELSVTCRAEVIDRRQVTDSGGHSEERPVIRSLLDLGGDRWPIEITLTSRENMLFRMLLGRTAMKGRALVNPGRSYLTGKR